MARDRDKNEAWWAERETATEAPAAPDGPPDVEWLPGAREQRDAGGAGSGPVKPLVEPESIRLGNLGWLDQEPPPIDWLLPGVLPLGEVGLVAGSGGAGKTWFMLQSAIAIASGGAVCGGPNGALWGVDQPRGVLLLNAEEKRDDLHRRLWAIMRQLRPGAGQDELLRQNLYIHSVRGTNPQLLWRPTHGGPYERRRVADEIQALAEAIPNLGLIVLEPVSRFRPEDEVNNEAATAMVAWMEHVSERTSSGMLAGAHTNKTSKGDVGLHQDAVRGASALVDGARWVLMLRRMTDGEAKEQQVGADDKLSLVQGQVVKANSVPPDAQRPFWLRRGDAGVLAYEPMDAVSRKSKRDDDATYTRCLPQLLKVIGELPAPLAARDIEREYVRRFGGPIECSQKDFRPLVNKAISQGDLHQYGGKLFAAPGKAPPQDTDLEEETR